MSGAADIEEQAARWIDRRSQDSWTPDEQALLDNWLQASTAHRVAYLRLNSVWRRADRLAVLGSGAAPPEQGESSPRRAWLRRVAAGIVLAGALSAILVVFDFDRQGETFTTNVGGHRTVPLPDGTRVELNTDTKIRAAVDHEHRVAWLERGEAYFDVAHDASRPFVVYAGDRRLTVLGTKFSVRRDLDEVKVAVQEGRVQVDAMKWPTLAPPVTMTAGDTVIARGKATLVPPKSTGRVADELSWRHGTLMFDKSTLTEVADEFNRYNRKKLIFGDQDVGQVRISGAFEAADVEAFARLLRQAFRLRVDDEGDAFRISN